MTNEATADRPERRKLQMLTAQEVSDLLRISERQVWRFATLAEAGLSEFPRPRRLSAKIVRFRQNDLERYEETQEHG